MLDAALAYAQQGWPVFPCSPENKQPLTPKEAPEGAKHGGLYWATTDAAQITAWWTRWPKAMIGLPTGEKAGCFVIDLDPRDHSADAMLQGLADWLGGGALPLCPLSRTQSGGLHLFFALPPEKLGNRAGLFRHIPDAPEVIRQHVDTRADGGYVIVPPSVMATGKAYVWEQDVAEYPLPAAPQRLIDAVAKRLDVRAREADIGIPISTGSTGIPIDPNVDSRIADNRHKYAMAALSRAISDLSRVGEGARGYELNRESYALGALVEAGILSESIAIAGMEDACKRNGLWDKDGGKLCRDNIVRAMGDGRAVKLDLAQIGTRVSSRPMAPSPSARAAARPLHAPTPDDEPPPPDSEADFENPTPLGDAERYGASHDGGQAAESSQGGAGADEKAEKRARSKARWKLRIDARCSALPQTDLGNAQRFVQRYGRNFFYVEQWGWLAWDGRRWNTRDAEAILSRAVHATVKAISAEARVTKLLGVACDEPLNIRVRMWNEGEGDDASLNPIVDVKKGDVVCKADKLAGWAMASQSNAHISCIARLAQAYLTATPDRFDTDLQAFNVANGCLRIAKRDGGADYVSFTRHAREDMMTRISEVVYDRDVQCPVYDAFLAKVQPDAAMRRHLHAWGGISLTGLPLARMAFWYGKGRNGKSTLADVWARVIGEYSQTIPIESFLDQGRARRGGEASPDIAALPGVRFLRTSEPEKGAQLAESLVKLVTGGEPLRARHLNRDFFEFLPAFKLTMQGNYRPNVTGTDEGFWRRMLLVPWSVTIAEGEVDVSLPDKLRAEASGILNRLLDGLCDYLDNGISPTAEIIGATADYRDDSDPVGRFLRECTIDVPPSVDEQGKRHDSRVTGKEIYETYVAWAKAEGEKPWSPKGFSRGLQDHGIKRLKSSGIFYLGITMTKFAESFEGQEIQAYDDKKKH